MGLTGFNRQRKRALSAELDIDERLADKLLAFGYSTPQAVKDAGSLSFLSDDELKQLKRKPKKKAPEPEKEKPVNQEPENKPAEVKDVDDLDEEFLALPDDTVFPYQINGGWHYLSNGEKVNGKAKAQKEQAELEQS